MTRTCCMCKSCKPLEDFSRNEYRCRPCNAARGKAWKASLPPGRFKELDAKWRETRRPKRQQHSAMRRWLLKMQIFEKYGFCCAKCGFKDVRALQIDHVNGDGYHDRLTNGYKGASISFFSRVLADDSGAYQLLCANCNWMKRLEDGSVKKPQFFDMEKFPEHLREFVRPFVEAVP